MNFAADVPHFDKKRILVDLKPAFDGFAGIPQETRLVFSGLRQLPIWDVKGLVQHGGRRLGRGLKVDGKVDAVSQQIYRLSKLIVSLNERPYSNVWERIADGANKHVALELLRMRSALGMTVPHTIFDSSLFPDFVWRTFFDKTLGVEEKDAVSQDKYYVIQPPRVHFQKVGLRSYSSNAAPRFPTIDTRGFDYFLAQTPFPGRLTKGTQMIVRYHDAVPILMPHTIKDKAFHQATHYQAVLSNLKSGAKFACISEATRSDLLTVFPEARSAAFVIHNMVSSAYYPDGSARDLVPRVIRNRCVDGSVFSTTRPLDTLVPDDFQYLLMVGTIEPRKNHALLLSAWERLKYTTDRDLKLVIVGSVGWDEGPVLRAFKPWATKGDLFYLQNVPSAELRTLYSHALVTVCPSLAEGFDYCGIEAMRCGSPVASSDIPVHREIYQDASVYFSPYSVDAAAEAIGSLLTDAQKDRRANLIERGFEVSERYLPRNILPRWVSFFEEIEAGVTPARHQSEIAKREGIHVKT
jgi:glycosyltransferase involved in cell wall biosynthesis